MGHQTVKGLVIRETNFGESNRYITVLTEQGAQIEVLCKNVRQRNGRFSAAVRLFCWSELTLYENREKYHLQDATLLYSFWSVTQQIEIYTLSCYFAECALTMSDADVHTPELTRLLLYALWAMAEQGREARLVKAAFELKLMALSGFAPDLHGCTVCQCAPQSQIYFSIADGVILDASCAKRIGGSALILLSSGTFAAMVHILQAEIPKVFSFQLGANSGDQLVKICEAYARYHMDRGFSSLDFYHTLCP